VKNARKGALLLLERKYGRSPDSFVNDTDTHRGHCRPRGIHAKGISRTRTFVCTIRNRRWMCACILAEDTFAHSVPALAIAIEVLEANGVKVMDADKDEYGVTLELCRC
jgi:phosphoglucomutase